MRVVQQQEAPVCVNDAGDAAPLCVNDVGDAANAGGAATGGTALCE